MASATLTSKWQMVIPPQVREHLRVQPGDQVDFVIRENGDVVVQPAAVDVTQLRGILRRSGGKVVSAKQMREAVRRRSTRSL